MLSSSGFAQNSPHIGYVYPAGGRQGATFQAVVGGQFLNAVSNAYVSGDDVQAKVIEFNRPLGQKEFNDLRDRIKVLQDKRQSAVRSPNSTNTWTTADEKEIAEIRAKILKNPPNRQGNPAIAETITVQFAVSTNAEPGKREIRLATPNGLSNPLVFCIGQLPEFTAPAAKPAGPEIERLLERWGKKPEPKKFEARVTIPTVVNGQIMPGAVDRFRFSARKGQQLVIALNARGLIPYLADAVPGWFQATLALYDAKGKELAYDDDYRFSPDPVLHYEILRDGEYVIEIKDSIYRGREDFVYRLTIGELPFITSIFPLGGPAGRQTSVELKGWNLPATNLVQNVSFPQSGVYQLSTRNGERISNLMPFAVDTLPECLEAEPNNSPDKAQRVALPIIVNGHINQPGDSDVFSFQGRAGSEIVAEVLARRLNSPVDSVLRLTDATGKQLAMNDDHEDKGAGLETHHADSYLRATLPADGTYFIHLADTQNQGGPEFSYRLRLSAPRPDFELRIVPSSLSARGAVNVPVTVYALRKDGFTNEITLDLKDAPEEFSLTGARVPTNQDQARFTISLQPRPQPEPIALRLEGRATIGGEEVTRPAVPADDLMQAFAYRHLVPAKALEVAPHVRPLGGPRARVISPTPVKIPVGGTAKIQIGALPGRFTDNFQLELDDPPEGITLEKVVTNRTGVELVLRCDPAKPKPPLEGNLIVNVVPEKNPGAGPKGRPLNQRRAAVGTLPAIPFEIVAE